MQRPISGIFFSKTVVENVIEGMFLLPSTSVVVFAERYILLVDVWFLKSGASFLRQKFVCICKDLWMYLTSEQGQS